MNDIYSDILGACALELPPFEENILTFRDNEISKCASYMEEIYKEVVKLFTKDGLEYVGFRRLTPEEKVNEFLASSKAFQKLIDVTESTLDIYRYEVRFNGEIHASNIYLPVLKDHAIIISGTKYYLQFVIADYKFFHTPSKIGGGSGIGIKVMRGVIKFYRNLNDKYRYTAMSGKFYTDDIITVDAHQKSKKSRSKRDLKTSLLLYSLIKRGFLGTLAYYGIDPSYVQFTTTYDPNDTEFEYFKYRGVCTIPTLNATPTARELLLTVDSVFYCKVHKSVLNKTRAYKHANSSADKDIFDKERIQGRVVSSILYNLQYFELCNSVLLPDNEALVETLTNDPVIWLVILGKITFGLTNKSVYKETQAASQADQHIKSLDSGYIDSITHAMLSPEIKCDTVYDLFDFMFENLDSFIVKYVPMKLYGKRISVLDILMAPIRDAIFMAAYQQLKRKITSKEIKKIMKAGSRRIIHISDLKDLARNFTSRYNDNYLISVGLKKIRATGSGVLKTDFTSAADGKKARNDKRNLMAQKELQLHHSTYVAESANDSPSTRPGTGGSINPYMKFSEYTGEILEPAHAKFLVNTFGKAIGK